MHGQEGLADIALQTIPQTICSEKTIVLGIMINQFLISEGRYLLGLSRSPFVNGALEPMWQLATILLEQGLLGFAPEYWMGVRSTVKTTCKLGKVSSLRLPLLLPHPSSRLGPSGVHRGRNRVTLIAALVNDRLKLLLDSRNFHSLLLLGHSIYSLSGTQRLFESIGM